MWEVVIKASLTIWNGCYGTSISYCDYVHLFGHFFVKFCSYMTRGKRYVNVLAPHKLNL
jgi:hypothetical protein